MKLPRAIGHRGLAALAPENTLGGMRCAKQHGFSWVEFDVRLTLDGVPVLLHDASIDRTTTGSGPLSGMTLAELHSFTATNVFDPTYSDEIVPTLEQVLSLCSELELGANIELKLSPGEQTQTAALVDATVKAIRKQQHAKPIPLLLSSLEEQVTRRIAEEHPELPLGYLTDDRTSAHDDLLHRMEEFHCISFHCPIDWVTPELAASVHERGCLLLAFTVKEAGVGLALFEMGVDGVFSNVPLNTRTSYSGANSKN